MILRKEILLCGVITILLAINRINCEEADAKNYDENDWIPIAPKHAQSTELAQPVVENVEKKATGRVLNLAEVPANSFFPEEVKPQRNSNFQQYLRETTTYQKPVQTVQHQPQVPVSVSIRGKPQAPHPYKFETSRPSAAGRPSKPQKEYYVQQVPQQTQQPQQAQFVQYYQPQEYHTIPDEYLSQPLRQSQPQQQYFPQNFEIPDLPPIRLNATPTKHERRPKPVKQIDLGPNKHEDKENVQLLYVPLESLQAHIPGRQELPRLHAYQQAPVVDLPQQFQYRPIAPAKQQQINNIQSDFARQALEAHKLQLQLQQQPQLQPEEYTRPVEVPPEITTTTTKKPTSKKRKAHQPPLAVYMGGASSSDVNEVLALLKDAKSIDVQDSVGPNSPNIFVGPSNLEAPRGYTKFELPYLSSLDTNRVERKVDQYPFFVAPLSYKAPTGYSKIPLPSPHVGSVVISTKEKQSTPLPNPSQLQERPQSQVQPDIYQQFTLQTQPQINSQFEYQQKPAISSSTPRYSKPIPEEHVIKQHEIDQINSFIPQFNEDLRPDTRFSENLRGHYREPEVLPEKYHIESYQTRPTTPTERPRQSTIRFASTAQPQLTEQEFIDEILQQQHQPATIPQVQEDFKPVIPTQNEGQFLQEITRSTSSPHEQDESTKYERSHASTPTRGRPTTISDEHYEQETITKAPTRIRTRPTQSQTHIRETYENPIRTTHLRGRPTTSAPASNPEPVDQYLKESAVEPKPVTRAPISTTEKPKYSIQEQFSIGRSTTPSPLHYTAIAQEYEEEIKPHRPVIYKYKQSDVETEYQQPIYTQSTPRPRVHQQQLSQEAHDSKISTSSHEASGNLVTGPGQQIYQFQEHQQHQQNDQQRQQNDQQRQQNQEQRQQNQQQHQYNQQQHQQNQQQQQQNQQQHQQNQQQHQHNQQHYQQNQQQHQQPQEEERFEEQEEQVRTQNANVENYNIHTQQHHGPLPNLINNLEDQSVRQLLQPGLIPTSPKTGDVERYEISSHAPHSLPTTTQTPSSNYPSTHLPVVETTTPRRVTSSRGRVRGSRFSTTTPSSVSSTRRTSVTRGRRPLTSRTRYQEENDFTTENTLVKSTTDPTKKIVTARSRFRTRGRPIAETTDRVSSVYEQADVTPSHAQNGQVPSVQIIEPHVTQRVIPQYVQKANPEYINYRPVYNVPADESEIVLVNNKKVSKPATEPVVIHQINQLPIRNLEEDNTENTSSKIRVRGRRPLTSTTAVPQVETSRKYETDSEQGEEFYGFFREPTFKKPTEPPPPTETPRAVYSSTYVSSTLRPYTHEEESPQVRYHGHPTTENANVQFVGEIRPKFQTTAQYYETSQPSISTERFYQSTGKETVEEEKPRVRTRARIPTRTRVTSSEKQVDDAKSTVTQRPRARGKTHYRVPQKPPRKQHESSEDEDVEGGNYPVQFKSFQTTPRPSFQITVDPSDDQEGFQSIYRPTYIAKDNSKDDLEKANEKVKDQGHWVENYQNQNYIATDSKGEHEVPFALPSIATAPEVNQSIQEEQEKVSQNEQNVEKIVEQMIQEYEDNDDQVDDKTEDAFDTTGTTIIPETTTHKRRRGVWKLIRRPVDVLEGAESQNTIGNKNLLETDEKNMDFEAKKVIELTTLPMTTVTLPEITTIGVSSSSTTTEDSFFGSIYNMFGISEDKTQPEQEKPLDEDIQTTIASTVRTIIPETTYVPEGIDPETTQTAFTYPTTTTTTTTTTEKPIVEFETTSPSTSMTYITPMSLETWNKGILKTSTSTEISHETEICYKGKCIKSKDMKVPVN